MINVILRGNVFTTVSALAALFIEQVNNVVLCVRSSGFFTFGPAILTNGAVVISLRCKVFLASLVGKRCMVLLVVILAPLSDTFNSFGGVLARIIARALAHEIRICPVSLASLFFKVVSELLVIAIFFAALLGSASFAYGHKPIRALSILVEELASFGERLKTNGANTGGCAHSILTYANSLSILQPGGVSSALRPVGLDCNA